jgi:hypothetical protein
MTVHADRRLKFDMPLPEGISEGPVDVLVVIAKKTPAAAKTVLPQKSEEQDVELINLYADELNKEAEDVHSYQEYFWEHYGSPWDHEP